MLDAVLNAFLLTAGIAVIMFACFVLWFVAQVTIELFDWLFGAIETAWRKASGR